ncbi:hypothetical protein N7465_008293 [Penicillium sp. CMV-2018d]|nr:hypothetical protein N7465_008293 [Penicillium sp. CMV-2018d]
MGFPDKESTVDSSSKLSSEASLESICEKPRKLVAERDTISWIHIVGIKVIMSNLVVVGMAIATVNWASMPRKERATTAPWRKVGIDSIIRRIDLVRVGGTEGRGEDVKGLIPSLSKKSERLPRFCLCF